MTLGLMKLAAVFLALLGAWTFARDGMHNLSLAWSCFACLLSFIAALQIPAQQERR